MNQTPTSAHLHTGASKTAGHGKPRRTPHQILGPYFPTVSAPISNGDLTAADGREGRASGEIIEVKGHILNHDGDLVCGVRLLIWQANTFGRYAHPNDSNPALLDANFTGFAEIVSDHDGAYRIKTVKPGIYPVGSDQMRPPHIHFEVHGKYERLITQMYFPGEPLNACDRFLMSTNHPELLVAKPLALQNGIGPRAFEFDIVLTRG